MPASFIQQCYEPLARHALDAPVWFDQIAHQHRRQVDPAFDAVWSAVERLNGGFDRDVPHRVVHLLGAGKQRRAELALFRATGLTAEQADLIGDRYLYGRDGYQERW